MPKTCMPHYDLNFSRDHEILIGTVLLCELLRTYDQ